jgi:hypothetical protein
MSAVVQLLSFGLRQIFDGNADTVLHAVLRHCTNHTQTLPKALNCANVRAWRALKLALAGDGILDGVKDLFRDADLKAVREDIRAFLDTQPTWQHLDKSFRKAWTKSKQRKRPAN